MSKISVILSPSWPTSAAELIAQLMAESCDIKQIDALPSSPSEYQDVFKACQVYCTTSLDHVNAELIHNAPSSLKLIANCGAGYDKIDTLAAKEKGIAVSTTPDAVTEDTADIAFSLILACSRRLRENETLVREALWQPPETIIGTRVHGKTIGIIGLGRIGQALARRAEGFGMPVLYHNRNAKPELEKNFRNISYCSTLEELLSKADISSIHCPMNEENRHLIDTKALAAMKPQSILINTARGELVDEAALLKSLESGHLSSAGLDVYEREPEMAQALREHPNTCLLPHIGSATNECRQDMALEMLANLGDFIQGKEPRNQLKS